MNFNWHWGRVLGLSVAISAAAASVPAPARDAPGGRQAELDAVFAELRAYPPALRMIVQKMPKGGDLHHHMGGGIYAEDFLRWTAEKNGCLDEKQMKLVPGPCAAPASVPVKGLETADPVLYSRAIDALSTRGFYQGVGDPTVSGHDRFFATFGQFIYGAEGKDGEVLAVSKEQAAFASNYYLELMAGSSIGREVRSVDAGPWNEQDLRGRLARLQPGIDALMQQLKAEIDAREARAAAIGRCGTPAAAPGCKVTVRYIAAIGREQEPADVFAQMALSFAMVRADPRYVAVNILAPEDGPISLRDYRLHMRLFAFFRTVYPGVPLTLHAGELAPGLVPPRDLRFHIAEAVAVAGARRIGHGVDIASEEDAPRLLQRMARERIAVEINLSSNDVILGVKGRDHPLRLYLAAGVPVTISTDDAGVSRGSLNDEYLRAVLEHGLTYSQLKQIARNSINFSFLEGAGILDAEGKEPAGPCSRPALEPTKECRALLNSSAKAREQWRLERDFLAFEEEALDIRNSIAARGAL